MLPARWDICGVVVPSLTLWHVFALDNIGCHYIDGGPVSKDDAACLLLIAGTDYESGRRLLAVTNTRQRVLAMTRISRRLKRIALSDLHLACLNYVASCTRTIRRWRTNKQQETANNGPSNEFFLVHNQLCRDYHMTPVEAWNTPYALARCYYDAGAIARGDNMLMTPFEQELDDRMFAEHQRERDAACQPLPN
jgi:hypothetical protein